MNKQKIKSNAKIIIEQSEFVHLGTIDKDGYPNIRLMFNLKRKDQFPRIKKVIDEYNEGFTTYIGANTSSDKILHIKNNKKASVYYEITKDEWQGLMLLGIIEFIEDKKIKRDLWEDNWKIYYPKGMNDPDFTILKFKPFFLKLYTKLRTYNLEI